MKTEDLFTFIEILLSRDDGFNPAIEKAKNLNTRGDREGAIAALLPLPDHVLSRGCMVAHPETRGALIPDQSAIPDFIKAARAAAKKPAAKPPEEKKK